MSQTPTLHDPAASRGAGTDAANALPAGHRLHEFELRGVIGSGGFGIVYRAFDLTLEREVAIKEYMPSALAGRSGKQQVSLLSASHSETFALGLGSFVNEAKLLARFDHPSLVKVHRFWEDNGTAYMVMPLYPGITLRRLREQRDACPGGVWLMLLLEGLLGALEVLHREGVTHRDIAPDNVLVSGDAPPVLLDFGAARRVIGDRSQALTAILKPSYAPIEQYAESSGMRQGPWTDFYALGATLHYLITGKAPMSATARAVSDEQPRLAGSGQGGVPDLLLQVCDWMLAPKPQDRPRNVAELRAALAGQLPVPQRERPVSANSWQTTVVQMDEGEPEAAGQRPRPLAQDSRRSRARTLWAVATAMVMAAAVGAWWASANAPVSDLALSTRAPIEPDADAARSAVAPATPRDDAPSAGEERAEPQADDVVRKPAKPVRAGGNAAVKHRAAPGRSAAAARGTLPAAPSATTMAIPPATPPTAPPADPPTGPPAATEGAPVSVAAVTSNPRERCAGRHLVAMHRCLVRECEKPEYSAHRECRRVREIELNARALRDNR